MKVNHNYNVKIESLSSPGFREIGRKYMIFRLISLCECRMRSRVH